MSITVDNRQVVLLKSLRTNNRFYTLVDPASGMKNADAIDEFPPELPLGIAYPCLEDGLNDFAVSRTTFETIEVFPDDDELGVEMMGIIDDARGNLVRRLQELRDRIVDGQAHFLGTNLQEFKDHVVQMATRGTVRRTLDSMMKVDVFESVARAGGGADPMYRYEFLPEHNLQMMMSLTPRVFIGRLFDDVLDSVTNVANYDGKQRFDRMVFQKFIAVMFVNYATTDPMFYGTNRDDYGVSSDKDMSETPLYRAVKAALRDLERGREYSGRPSPSHEPEPEPGEDLSSLFEVPTSAEDFLAPVTPGQRMVEIPYGAVENQILKPLTRLSEAMRLLKGSDHPRSQEVRAMAIAAGKELFRNLQEMNIVSPLARDPMDDRAAKADRSVVL